MWFRLQVYENDCQSVLGIAVGANGDFYFRATDVLRLMGWNRNPWSKLKKLLPVSRPVQNVVPSDIPLSFGGMLVVTFHEMLNAIVKASETSNSLFHRNKNKNLASYIANIFTTPHATRVEKIVTDIYYTTNPTRAALFKITTFSETTESLEMLLHRARSRFVEMYNRLSSTNRFTIEQIVRQQQQQQQQSMQVVDINDDDNVLGREQQRLVIDENEKDQQPRGENDDDDDNEKIEFKIYSRSEPPKFIEWVLGSAKYTFKCVKYIKKIDNESVTLYRNTNQVYSQVEKE